MREKAIDLNVDIGEGFEHDVELLEYATSANIACGWHAGDATTMRRVAQAAIRLGVAVGAHPSFPDRENFGRASMNLPTEEIYAGIQYQIGALAGIVEGLGGHLAHVKPHGALYNQAEEDSDVAHAIVHAVRDFDLNLAIFGLAGGQLISVAREAGLSAIEEGFADRAYTPAGKLVPRSEPHALLDSDDDACDQAVSMARDHRLRTRAGNWVKVRPQTLCLHGDGMHAIAFAQRIRKAFLAVNVTVACAEIQKSGKKRTQGKPTSIQLR